MFTMAVNLVGGGGNRHSPINIKTRIIVHSDLRNKKRGLMLKVYDFPICDNTKIEVMRSGLKTVLSPSAKPTTDIVITAKFQKVSATDNLNTTAISARPCFPEKCEEFRLYSAKIAIF